MKVSLASPQAPSWLTGGMAFVLTLASGQFALPMAQVPGDWPAVGVTSPGRSCAQRPGLNEVPAYSTTTGRHDVWIYPVISCPSLRSIRMGATWPLGWTVVDLELCGGTLIDAEMNCCTFGFELDLPTDVCPSEAMIRLGVEAPFPGTFSLGPHPRTGEFGYQYPNDPSGDWRPFFDGGGGPTPEYAYVEIGERCGWSPLANVGDWCDLFVGNRPAGYFCCLPDVMFLPLGEVYVDTLSIGGDDECKGPPECLTAGVSCYGGLTTSTSWISLQYLDTGFVEITIDTNIMGVGNHTGNLRVTPGCFLCRETCQEFTLVVEPMAVEPATWGRLKARYR